MGEAIHLYKVRLGRAHNGGIGNELVDAAVANRAAIGSEARDMTVPLVPTTSAPSYTREGLSLTSGPDCLYHIFVPLSYTV